MAKKGDWVQIHIEVLKPSERAANIPEDTSHVPLEMWVKGNLIDEAAEIGDIVRIITRTGRTVSGSLCAAFPCFTHSFGEYVPELHRVDDMVKAIVFGGENNA